MPNLLFLIGIILILLVLKKYYFTHVTVMEAQRGLLYRYGKQERVLEPGRYLIFRPSQSITIIDMRLTAATVANQEILSADNIAIRVSVAASYKVNDPVKAVLSCKSYSESLHLTMQLVIRELVSTIKIDELLQRRNELSDTFFEKVKPYAEIIGLHLEQGGIKDITFPGELKKVFAQVIQAEKSAQAALAKSRSEIAALRALANAARMLESNPNLLILRTLQAITELATSSGNTIVLGLPSPMVPLKINSGKEPILSPATTEVSNTEE